jgi:hypothetical protein
MYKPFKRVAQEPCKIFKHLHSSQLTVNIYETYCYMTYVWRPVGLMYLWYSLITVMTKTKCTWEKVFDVINLTVQICDIYYSYTVYNFNKVNELSEVTCKLICFAFIHSVVCLTTCHLQRVLHTLRSNAFSFSWIAVYVFLLVHLFTSSFYLSFSNVF